MRTAMLLGILACVAASFADEPITLSVRGDFEYTNQKVAVVPYECGSADICDEIVDVFSDMMFEQFDTNFVADKKLRKALKQARLKKLEPENMPAIANHLKVDVFVSLKLEIEESRAEVEDDAATVGEDFASSLLKATLQVFDPKTGKEILTVEGQGRTRNSAALREWFEQMFQAAFD